jgi:TPR repeat protein
VSKKYILLWLSLVAIFVTAYVTLASGLLNEGTLTSFGSREASSSDDAFLSVDRNPTDWATSEDSQPLEDIADTGSSPRYINDLLARADAGDVDASYQAGKSIWQCRNIPLSVDDYNLQLGKMPIHDQPPQGNYNIEIERIEKCLGVPRDRMTVATYYKAAADSGNLDAIYEYATILPFLHDIEPDSPDFGFSEEHVARLSELDEHSIEYFFEGATQGDLRSAVALAAKYQYGFDVLVQGDRRSLRQPDLMRAYAWYFAANIAQGGTGLQAWKTSIHQPLQESGLVAEAQALGQEYFEAYLQDINGGASQ